MKKGVSKIFDKKKKTVLLFMIAALLLISFLYICRIYRGYHTENTDMKTFLAGSGLKAEVSYLPNENKVQNKNSMSSAENVLIEQMVKDLESITVYLEDLEEAVEKNKKEILRLEINRREGGNELQDNDDSTDQNLSDEVKNLMEHLNQVSDKITSTQNDIKEALADSNNANSSWRETVLGKFTDITINLADINVSVDTAHTELKKMIEAVKTDGKENHKELLTVLEELTISFSEENTSNLGALLISLQTQSDTLKTQYESIDNNLSNGFGQLTDNVTVVNRGITDTKTEVLEGLQKIDTNMGRNYTSAAMAIADSREAIIERIASMEAKTDNRLDNLDSAIQSVFQSVSDGKKLLATALLTKNVTVADDAAFVEMQQAILAIPQKIVIGVEQVPGEIEYTYHYHTGDTDNGGGCYTVRLYHQHSAECYTKATCQPYCLGLTHASRNDHWDVHENSRFMHPDCGMGIIYRSPKHFVGDPCNCDKLSSHTYDRLSCGKTNATPEGWAAGCGFVNGQIIEVRIIYNTDAAETRTVDAITQGKEYIPRIYDDYTMDPQQASDENKKETEWESTGSPGETEGESAEIPMETEGESADPPGETERESADPPGETEEESAEIPMETERESTQVS